MWFRLVVLKWSFVREPDSCCTTFFEPGIEQRGTSQALALGLATLLLYKGKKRIP